MACCGDIPQGKTDGLGEHREGDILARPRWHAAQKTHGRVSHRAYGKINRSVTVWIDPRDFYANEWIKVEDWDAATDLSAIHAFLTAPDYSSAADKMSAAVAKAGVRVWSDPPLKVGFDMQQVPGEAGVFLAAMQAANVQTVLEVGTGESGGFARFMVEVLGWNVVSLDLNKPTPNGGAAWPDGWAFVQGDTRTLPLKSIPTPDGGLFDLVFIDGDHSYDGVKNDYERFAHLGRIVGFHDVAPDSWFTEGVDYWREISRVNGVLREGWHEIILPQSRAGIGWVDEGYHLDTPPDEPDSEPPPETMDLAGSVKAAAPAPKTPKPKTDKPATPRQQRQPKKA